jgi:hypothetical protein
MRLIFSFKDTTPNQITVTHEKLPQLQASGHEKMSIPMDHGMDE